MTDFTEGPWKVDSDQYGCRTIKGGKSGKHKQAQYKRLATTEGTYPDEEDAANARLMAASPALYAVATDALEHLTDALLYPDDDPLVQDLHAALAKVSGDGD